MYCLWQLSASPHYSESRERDSRFSMAVAVACVLCARSMAGIKKGGVSLILMS